MQAAIYHAVKICIAKLIRGLGLTIEIVFRALKLSKTHNFTLAYIWVSYMHGI